MHVLLEEGAAPAERYASDNPRFRKAYIRERLKEIGQERDALLAERQQILSAAPVGQLPNAIPVSAPAVKSWGLLRGRGR